MCYVHTCMLGAILTIYTYIVSVYVVCMLGAILTIYLHIHVVSVHVCGMYICMYVLMLGTIMIIYLHIVSVQVVHVCMLGAIVNILMVYTVDVNKMFTKSFTSISDQ